MMLPSPPLGSKYTFRNFAGLVDRSGEIVLVLLSLADILLHFPEGFEDPELSAYTRGSLF